MHRAVRRSYQSRIFVRREHGHGRRSADFVHLNMVICGLHDLIPVALSVLPEFADSLQFLSTGEPMGLAFDALSSLSQRRAGTERLLWR